MLYSFQKSNVWKFLLDATSVDFSPLRCSAVQFPWNVSCPTSEQKSERTRIRLEQFITTAMTEILRWISLALFPSEKCADQPHMALVFITLVLSNECWRWAVFPPLANQRCEPPLLPFPHHSPTSIFRAYSDSKVLRQSRGVSVVFTAQPHKTAILILMTQSNKMIFLWASCS